jgi:trigger factor
MFVPMQVTETLSDGLKRAYSVVVPAAEIESKWGAKLAEIGRTIRLPGFRPGKVPVNLVRQRYGASVMAEVMQDALSTAADQVIEERGLRPAGQPKIALAGEPNVNAKAASDLAFNVELEILPEITAPDLASLNLVRYRAEVATDKIDETLATIAKQQRDTTPIEEDRGAETGEVLTVDFLGTVDGVPFEGGAGEDAKVEIGGQGFVPGFSEGMLGMKVGEVRDIDVTFPTEYHAEALAGKAAVFKITAKSLAKPIESEIDDALAVKLGFESLEKLRETILGQMQRELDGMARLRIKRELLDVLAEKADFPAPQNLVDAEFGAIWQRVEQDMKSGQIDEEDKDKDPETLKAEYRAIADRRVRLGLLLSEIGRAARIEVAQAELTAALRQEASRYPGQEMQVVEFFRKTPGAIEQLRGPLFEDKVVDYILEMAKVEDRLVAPEDLAMPEEEAAPKLSFEPSEEPEPPEAPIHEAAAPSGDESEQAA